MTTSTGPDLLFTYLGGNDLYAQFSDDLSEVYNVYDETGLTPDNIVPAGGVPEPATWTMMLLGFAGIGIASRRRSTVKASA